MNAAIIAAKRSGLTTRRGGIFVVEPRQQRRSPISDRQHGRDSVTTGSDRASRLPWLVWRITLESRRAIIWAVRKSVSANTTMTDPSS